MRRALHDDLQGIQDLYRHLHPNDPVPDQASAGRAWSALLGSGLTTVFVACAGAVLGSTCVLAVVPNLTRNARPFGVIENVVTRPELRRLGLGRAVLVAALAEAWASNCYKVMLATGSQREETLRFYAASGFARDGKTAFQARRPTT